MNEKKDVPPGLSEMTTRGFYGMMEKMCMKMHTFWEKEQQEVESLYEKLVAYGAGDACPFHMPGHKRNMGKWGFADPFSFDITEIDGFDNLHHAEGILKAARSGRPGCMVPGGRFFSSMEAQRAFWRR